VVYFLPIGTFREESFLMGPNNLVCAKRNDYYSTESIILCFFLKEVLTMEKSLNCKDVGSDCDFSVCAKTEDGIFEKVKDHARQAHNMSEIPKDFYDKARSAIRDVKRC
jgi:predicted small metal-binding protein